MEPSTGTKAPAGCSDTADPFFRGSRCMHTALESPCEQAVAEPLEAVVARGEVCIATHHTRSDELLAPYEAHNTRGAAVASINHWFCGAGGDGERRVQVAGGLGSHQ